MNVGVRELKAKLSHYIARAAAGDDVVITDRGTPVARLVPLVESSALERGFVEGWAEVPQRTQLGEPLLLASSAPTQRVLDADRGD